MLYHIYTPEKKTYAKKVTQLVSFILYGVIERFKIFIYIYLSKSQQEIKLEDRSQKKKIMFLHSKNKASRKGYKGEC